MKSQAISVEPEQLLEHAAWIRELARSLVADASTADDLAQDTLLAALRSSPSASRPLRPWLAAVLRKQLALWKRSRANRAQREHSAAAEEELPSASELVERAEMQRRLVDAVLALEHPYRSVLLLRYYEGLSAAEIARRWRIPDATVRSQLKRGLEQIRGILDHRHGGNRREWIRALAPLFAAGERSVQLADTAPAGPAPSQASPVALGAAAVILAGVFAIAWMRSESARESTARSDPAGADSGGLTAAAPESTPGPRAITEQSAQGRELAVERYRGSLRESDTDRPLAEYLFEVSSDSGSSVLVTTDSSSRFEFAWSSARSVTVRLLDHARMFDREGQVHGLELDYSAAAQRVELTRTGDLELRADAGPTYLLGVSLPDGMQPDDFFCHLRPKARGPFLSKKWQMHVAPLRAAGESEDHWVRFPPLNPGVLGADGPWVLEVCSSDGLWFGAVEVTSVLGEYGERLSFELKSCASLSGGVSDGVGPLAGEFVVRLVRASGERLPDDVADIDAQGGYRLRWIPPGSYALKIESQRHQPFETALGLLPGQGERRDFVLTQLSIAGEVSGRLESRTGRYQAPSMLVLEPIPSTGSQVSPLLERATWSQLGEVFVADFRFAEVPAGRYRLGVFASQDLLSWSGLTGDVSPPCSGIRLQVDDQVPTADLGFRIADAETGESIEELVLAVQCDDGIERTYRCVPSGAGTPRRWSLSAAGFAWTTIPDPTPLARFPVGSRLRFAVHSRGYVSAYGDEQDFEFQGGRAFASIPLRRGFGGVLSLETEDGTPLAGIEVSFDGRLGGRSGPGGILSVELDHLPASLSASGQSGELSILPDDASRILAGPWTTRVQRLRVRH